MKRRFRIVAVVAATALSAAAGASAAPRQESVFEDDDLLLHSPTSVVEASMAELRSLGVDRVRIPALWRNIAPESPPFDATNPAAYPPERLFSLDRAISAAYSHGIAVLLNIRGGAPSWAQRTPLPRAIAGEDAYKPNVRAFGEFVEMLGRRYDGTYSPPDGKGVILPAVDAWSLWNEPNWGGLLQPQWERDRRTGRTHTYAPQLYRRLYRAGHAALQRTGHGANVILIGETAPLGNENRNLASPIYAALFYRHLFCLNRRLRPLHGLAARLGGCADFKSNGPLQTNGAAHHPYPVKLPPERRSKLRDEIRLADSRRLTRILDAAERYGRITGTVPVWYTEFGYQTKPPDPIRGVPLRRHAAWMVRSERIAFRDRRVLAFDQFLLRDAGPQTQYPRTDSRYWGTYQTGLRFHGGRKKPAYAAYRLPFMALDELRPGRPLRLWGMVRPGRDGEPQTVRIEHRDDALQPWAPVQTRTVTDLKGYFTARLQFARSGQYRFVWLGPEREVASRAAVTR